MKKLPLLTLAALLTAALYGQMPGGLGRGAPGGGSRAMSDARIKSDMALMAMDGVIPMRFTNALDGQGIPGGVVSINGVGDFVTDGRGIAQLPIIPDGIHNMVFSKDGFITTPIEFRVQLSTVIFNWFAISPGLNGQAYRFVLSWGERPADLDMHLEKSNEYHISYGNMHTSADGNANLDRDDTDSFGPETITVRKIDNAAAYDFYVIDYTNRQSSTSDALSRSGAVIRVYRDDRLAHTFNVPSGAGTRWNVFRIERNQLRPVNTMTR
ncbi:MAG: hypothetical protein LBF77_04945 [Spirochaetaceae bacterium]|jgi:hypothetical protein|nr:hypothetical protein [Spirochaetaceae bacterium]